MLHGNVEKQHECLTCRMTTKTTGLLQAHIDQVHNLNKPFKCSKCQKAFSTKKPPYSIVQMSVLKKRKDLAAISAISPQTATMFYKSMLLRSIKI